MSYSDGYCVHGVFLYPVTVVDIPEGYAFVKLRMRVSELVTVFLRNEHGIEQWHVQFKNVETKNELRPSYPMAKNIRKAA